MLLSSALSYLNMIMHKLGKLRCRQLKLALLAATILFILHYYGIFLRLREKSYDNFEYPLNIDMTEVIKGGRVAGVEPVNKYKHAFLIENKEKCSHSKVAKFLIFIVKSKLDNFDNRQAIRDTWGKERSADFPELPVQTVFMLGAGDSKKMQERIVDEYDEHQDIVQGDFVDAYYNNTIKTLMAMKWVVENCPKVRYLLFVDDDFYVNKRALIRHLHSSEMMSASPPHSPLFMGYVFHSRPQRHKPSKFYVTLEEYPYHRYPPFVAAGAYVLNSPALTAMHRTSQYTARFRFDDVYLGIVARKAGIVPAHNDDFYFWKRYYTPLNYRQLLVSHGFGEPGELRTVWDKQEKVFTQQQQGETVAANTWTDTVVETALLLQMHLATLFT